MKSQEVIVTDPAQTEKLGEEIASQLSSGDVLCLIGELGAGKTTFVKGLAKGLGITTRIMSPTYVVVREHEIERLVVNGKRKGIDRLYHLDLYRLTSEKDVLGIDIHTLLKDKNAVTVIEWPELANSFLPPQAWKISFEPGEKNKRKITIHKNS